MKILFVLLTFASMALAGEEEKMQPGVVLMNPFVIEDSEKENFLQRWQKVADYMREQPGFISTRLHQGLGDNKAYWFNYARFDSSEEFQAAISTPEFKEHTKNFPGEGQPRLYKVVRETSEP